MFGFNLFSNHPVKRDFVELRVTLPDGVRFIAQDDDGAWWGYANKPVYVSSQDGWFPDDTKGEPTSCFLVYGPVPFSARSTVQKVN